MTDKRLTTYETLEAVGRAMRRLFAGEVTAFTVKRLRTEGTRAAFVVRELDKHAFVGDIEDVEL